MKTLDHQVIQTCRDWLDRGGKVWLCTILRTLGSSPRPVGSLLAFNAEGYQVGSLSGGCVEDDLIGRVRAGEFEGTLPCIREYGLTAEENERLGLPCGGRLDVLVESLHDSEFAQGHLAELLVALEERRCVVRHLELASGECRLEPVAEFRPLAFDGERLAHCFGPHVRMLLVGAGQLTSH